MLLSLTAPIKYHTHKYAMFIITIQLNYIHLFIVFLKCYIILIDYFVPLCIHDTRLQDSRNA